jgi:hypothetical protein
LFLGAECGVNADVEKHLELGKKLLAAGQLADALSQFHAAVGLYHKPNHSSACLQILINRSVFR